MDFRLKRSGALIISDLFGYHYIATFRISSNSADKLFGLITRNLYFPLYLHLYLKFPFPFVHIANGKFVLVR